MRTLLSLALLASAAPAQTLLAWNGWQPWNAQFVTQLSVTPGSISFVPFAPGSPGSSVCGIEQQVMVPTDGTYQLHFIGGGGSTGVFSASWEIQGQQVGFLSDDQQHTWTFQLTAGMTALRLQTTTSNLTADRWHLQQPVLRPVSAPVVDIALVRRSMPAATITANAEFLLFAPQSQTPLSFPGILGGLELAPTGAIVLLASANPPPTSLQIDPFTLLGKSWPSFYLQALALTPSPRLGSALAVQPWRF